MDEFRQSGGANPKLGIVSFRGLHPTGAGPRAAASPWGRRFALSAYCAIIPRRWRASMLNPATLFRLFNELIVLLLGALLILLAVTRGVALPARPSALIALGVFLVYWGLRAWMRPDPSSSRTQAIIRAGSLALVGFLVMGIPLLPLRHATLVLAVAGGLLVVRGILCVVLLMRTR